MSWTEEDALAFEEENPRNDTEAAAAFISEMAGHGAVLELGSGTGRLLRPLADRCRQVVGVEISDAMRWAASRSPLPANASIVAGDMRTWSTEDTFDVVLIAFNSLLELASQAEQCAAIERAASFLTARGRLVVELTHPPLAAFDVGERTSFVHLPNSSVNLITQTLDWRTQRLNQTSIVFSGDVPRIREARWRMIYPAELDLMAKIGGLQLAQRLSSWRGHGWAAAARGESNPFISIYKRPDLGLGASLRSGTSE